MIRKPPHRVYILRHGQTDWNAQGRFQGRRDIPINKTGESQAHINGLTLRRCNENWANFEFICSPLQRTRQTMEIIRHTLRLPASSYKIDARLIEVTFGDWEGHTLSQMHTKSPSAVKERDAYKWTYTPNNGESYKHAAERVWPVIETLNAPSVLVTHGGIIRGLRHFFEDVDGNLIAHTEIPQDKIYYVDKDHAGWLN